jgi:hypothetical protein
VHLTEDGTVLFANWTLMSGTGLTNQPQSENQVCYDMCLWHHRAKTEETEVARGTFVAGRYLIGSSEVVGKMDVPNAHCGKVAS